MFRWDSVTKLLREPKLGAEVGVRAGRFTSRLLRDHPTLTMYAVDSWCPRPASPSPGAESYSGYDWASIIQEFHRATAPFAGRIVLLHMDSSEAARHVQDGSLDFCFIDADHSYEGVARDIDAWAPKVRKGGILSGHDYGHPRFPGVARAVDERFTVNLAPDNVWWMRRC
jgi:hypothetical protein